MSSLLIQNATAVVTMNEGREIFYGVDILCDDEVVKRIFFKYVGGAAIIGWPELGRIAVGHPADMFIIDASKLDWVGAEYDPAAALAVLGCQRPVSFTIVAGMVVASGGELVNVDEVLLAKRARDISRRLCAF